MERRQYVKTVGAAVVGSLVAGCSTADSENRSNGDGESDRSDGSGEGGGSATGTLSTSVTDQPVDIDHFESCVVTIEGIWVKPSSADGESDESEADGNGTGEDDPEEPEGDAHGGHTREGEADGDETDADEGEESETDDEEGSEDAPANESEGRRYIEFDEPQEADLVQLQGANTQPIDETELAAGEYRFLQLDVSGVEGTLADGGEAVVETPGNAPLQFKQSFEIRANEATRFVADFAPIRLGRGAYLLRPVATGTQVLYGDEEYDPEAGDENGSDPDSEHGVGNASEDTGSRD